MTSFELFIVLY